MSHRQTSASRHHHATASRSRATRLLLPLLVASAILLPTFALGGPTPTTPDVPDCTAAPPGLITPPPLNAPLSRGSAFTPAAARIGALPGAGSVTPSGEYTYRIPIEVPAGRNGLQPSLALVYGSRQKKGPFGVGWHLEGLSEIYRCPKTFATEGASDGVHYDNTDALCLDGRKLIPLGPYNVETEDCSGTEYRTEEDVFARIVSCEKGSSPARMVADKFLVWLKDGRIRTYDHNEGTTEEGDEVSAYNWLLSDERDRAGNLVHYSYNSGLHYSPKAIDYVFSDGTAPPDQGRRRVEFEGLDTIKILAASAADPTTLAVATTITRRLRSPSSKP